MALEIYIGLACIVISFVTTFFLVFYWIKASRKFGLVGRDINKFAGDEVPEAGGIAVILGFSFSILMFVFFKTFLLGSEAHKIEIFALLAASLLAGFLGFVDDILGWKRGIKQWHKPILTIPISLPLIVMNAGQSTMSVPILGIINFGVLYPLAVVPMGIVGAANGFNMLAGFNGLEALMGILILGFMGFVAWKTFSLWLMLIIFCFIAALFAFLVFNWNPAKIFPGNGMTYGTGALIAIVAILGNMEKTAIILFIPYFIEFFLKLRGKFKVESFGKPQKDGTLKGPDKCFSLTHIPMKYYPSLFRRGPRENEVVLFIVLVQLAFVAIAYINLN